jgi:hypothetical protein
MTEIEQFLAKQQLYRCERLNASLTKQTCESNRKRKPSFTTDIGAINACIGCKGLSGPVEVSKVPVSIPTPQIKEVEPMSSRGTCKHCKRSDMSLPIKDTCGRCRGWMDKGLDPLSGLPVVKKEVMRSTPTDEDKLAEINRPVKPVEDIKPVKVREIITQAPPQPEKTVNQNTVDLTALFLKKQAEEFDLFCVELEKRTDPFEKLKFVYEICNAN